MRYYPALLGGILLVGCGPRNQAPAPAKPPAIPVSQPVERTITDYVDFTGRTDAKEAVDVRARVTGYLVKIDFKEGSEVKAGDVLFEIDPRPYQAQLDQALSLVNLYKAQLKLAQTTYERDKAIFNQGGGAVSPQELDQDKAAVEQAQASVKAYEASLEVYKLNLSFTKVTSPIDGKISRYYLTVGNLVLQDQTLLTSVVSLDPMYAYFDMDEPTLLRIKEAVNQGKIKPAGTGTIPVFMQLHGESGYPHKGVINFINNQLNPTTGSITIRGVFDNPEPKGGTRLLLPGMFVRIRLPIGQPHPALLVIDRAIGSDQGLKYVYVVDSDNEVQYRRIIEGVLQPDGLRVVEKGLKKDDRVVVGAIQQVRPKMKIEPDPVAMPTLAPEGGEAEAAVAGAGGNGAGQAANNNKQ